MTWTLPTVSLLEPTKVGVAEAHPATSERLVRNVLSHVGLEVVEVKPQVAPQVVRYAVELAPGGDPKKIERAIEQISLAVKQPARFAGVADGHVMIEVNRRDLAAVGLRETIEAGPALIRLGFPLGIGVDGAPLAVRLADMPHLLVAGTTGSGKSVWLNSVLTTLLLRNTPDDMRLVMVDPKRVELAPYAGLPHLNGPIITEMADAERALRGLASTMDQRYSSFEAAGVKTIEGYNDQAPDGGHLPRLVLVVDELADLMLQARASVEPLLARLGALGRAAGIHLILATQRPDAKTFTSLLLNNIPARVVFAVQSHNASKIALGYVGAEKLRGKGDGFYKAPAVGEPQRFQAPMVPAADVARVVAFWKKQTPAAAPSPQPVEEPVDDGADLRDEVDAWLEEAIEDGAVSTLTAAEILGDAGISPLVIEALAEVLSDKIAARVVQKVASVLPSNPVNTTEGDI